MLWSLYVVGSTRLHLYGSEQFVAMIFRLFFQSLVMRFHPLTISNSFFLPIVDSERMLESAFVVRTRIAQVESLSFWRVPEESI